MSYVDSMKDRFMLSDRGDALFMNIVSPIFVASPLLRVQMFFEHENKYETRRNRKIDTAD